MRCRPILPYSAPPRFDQSHNSIAHTRWSDTPEAIKSGTIQGDQMELGNGGFSTENGELVAAEAINSGTDASLLSSRATVYRADFNITTVPLENGWGGRLGLVGRDRNRLQMEMGVSSYTIIRCRHSSGTGTFSETQPGKLFSLNGCLESWKKQN